MVGFNKKGQAAATDALIFLSIVGVVFALILGYSMNYGLNIMNSAESLYNENFHYAALKSFMSASFGRDGKDVLNTPIADSVATMIKEDYGQNSLYNIQNPTAPKQLISEKTQKAMFGVLDEVFLPLPQRSYLLLITHDASPTGTVRSMVPLIVLIRSVDEEGRFVYYSCFPDDLQKVEEYLESHTLDLEIVEGPFILYKNILSQSDEEEKKIKKEDGAIYLASWLSTAETMESYSDLRCEDITEEIRPP